MNYMNNIYILYLSFDVSERQQMKVNNSLSFSSGEWPEETFPNPRRCRGKNFGISIKMYECFGAWASHY